MLVVVRGISKEIAWRRKETNYEEGEKFLEPELVGRDRLT